MIYTCTVDTPLGAMTASAEKGALTGLWFLGEKYYPPKTDTWVSAPDDTVFQALQVWLSDYFSGKNSKPNLRLDPQGTPFQKTVWEILLKIPYGQVTTYGEIAKKIALLRGVPSMSAQAVGGAVGHNPISILIPCHRVIGSNGSLTGYAGGIDKKKALLELEYVDLDRHFDTKNRG
ncbi:methylated-DNA--[protein]-cysteine S-methyltransferase [Candidatus Formimonas warabiya]|uniref:Methylated-DNA--protein-cysteine methyltransferase n=1 Tax=Formimonas warabiya TaxID=1761012 RepID=A0A3G1KMA5_FORW1|nr:methylated-DNA--[protein]-cysteine S-methyltransferase [Candidatus Formimonas warabiya]ATW23582.1 cysteine methyltransferase [Candidatus Formimonas warabiya]